MFKINLQQSKTFVTLLLTLSMPLVVDAQTFTEWQDPHINQVNRLPAHASYFPYLSRKAADEGNMQQSGNYQSMNGQWKFHWVANNNERPTDFYTTSYDDKAWGTIAVPATWELNGYDVPLYSGTNYEWKDVFKNNPPYVPVEGNHIGSYRRSFVIPRSWKGRDVVAHFGAVSSNIYLWVNGHFAGYSEDSRVEAEFNITPYIKYGKPNLIAFQVFRWCDGSYMEDQDAMRYHGVFRDCYLLARARKRINDVRIGQNLTSNMRNGLLQVRLAANAKLTM